MPDNTPALVVVAAGGLGTRVHPGHGSSPRSSTRSAAGPASLSCWRRSPPSARPGSPIVYHPYYEQFAAWARQVLSRHDHARYAATRPGHAGRRPARADGHPHPPARPLRRPDVCPQRRRLPRRPGRPVRRVRRQPLPGAQPAAAAARRRPGTSLCSPAPTAARLAAQPGHPHHPPRPRQGSRGRYRPSSRNPARPRPGTGRTARPRQTCSCSKAAPGSPPLHRVRPRPPHCARKRTQARPRHQRLRPRPPRVGGCPRWRGHRPGHPGSPAPPGDPVAPAPTRPRPNLPARWSWCRKINRDLSSATERHHRFR